jgi:hypothetical protein
VRQLDRVARAAVKAILGRILDEAAYGVVQSRVMARDILRGRYSEPELDLVNQVVSPGDCVLDVGANYGLYSYHLFARGRTDWPGP